MMQPLTQPSSRNQRQGPTRRETLLSFAILGVLVLIALALFAVQARYDAGAWRIQTHGTDRADAPGLPSERMEALEQSSRVTGMTPMSSPEHFGAETLSDKIDGKAELYLPSGFKHLESRRLAMADDPGRWAERFVYDMGGSAGAFAVYSQQRREGAQPMEITPHAYRSANGIFLVQGPFYVEIIGSDTSATLMDKMVAMAEAFVAAHPADAGVAAEPDLLPAADRLPDSITLTAANAFGFEGFDQVYAARYEWNGRTALGYLSRRGSAEEAAALADAYIAFLQEFGGQIVAPPPDAPPVRIVEMFDLVQVVFTHNEWLAGVHEAETLADGLLLAERLHRNLSEAMP